MVVRPPGHGQSGVLGKGAVPGNVGLAVIGMKRFDAPKSAGRQSRQQIVPVGFAGMRDRRDPSGVNDESNDGFRTGATSRDECGTAVAQVSQKRIVDISGMSRGDKRASHGWTTDGAPGHLAAEHVAGREVHTEFR